jgi:hypothetical protein
MERKKNTQLPPPKSGKAANNDSPNEVAAYFVPVLEEQAAPPKQPTFIGIQP